MRRQREATSDRQRPIRYLGEDEGEGEGEGDGRYGTRHCIVDFRLRHNNGGGVEWGCRQEHGSLPITVKHHHGQADRNLLQ